MKGNSGYIEDWLEIAKKDWSRMLVMLKTGDIEAAGYFLQQSLEKFLKAFILQSNGKLKKIHELDALLDESVQYNSELSTFYPLCERVSGYYITQRYPKLIDDILDYEDIKNDIILATELVNKLFPAVKLG